MSNERDRILKLLEDGKITADQATRLIEAVGSERPEPEFVPAAAHAVRCAAALPVPQRHEGPGPDSRHRGDSRCRRR